MSRQIFLPRETSCRADVAAARGVSFDHIVKAYQPDRRVIDDISFDVQPGELIVLIGPSGCGKTTLLKMINRLIDPTSGMVYVGSTDVRSLEAVELRRGIGYVIQQVGLFPHMTVAENVAIVPSLLDWPRQRIQQRVNEMLALVHLPPEHFGARLPAALSGGQQQRVGIARALAADPPLLLMDEPFGALDAIERVRLQGEMAALHRQLRKTVVFVTHDVDEGMRLADSMVVMNAGQVIQHARPAEIVARPANTFVAELVGAGDLVRLFVVMKAGDQRLEPIDPHAAAQLPIVESDDNLRTVLSRMVGAGTLATLVRKNGSHEVAGVLTLERMMNAAHELRAGAAT